MKRAVIGFLIAFVFLFLMLRWGFWVTRMADLRRNNPAKAKKILAALIVAGSLLRLAPMLIRLRQRHAASLVLMKGAEPAYPPLARQSRIEGQVQLSVQIDRDGSVSDIHLKNGNPLLAQAAIDAASKWKYSPPLVDGHPASVRTTIIVNFSLTTPPDSQPK